MPNDKLDEIMKPILDSWASLADAYAEEVVLDSISGDIPIYWEEAKQAINDYIKERETVARIDEVKIKMGELLMDKRMNADDAIQTRLAELNKEQGQG